MDFLNPITNEMKWNEHTDFKFWFFICWQIRELKCIYLKYFSVSLSRTHTLLLSINIFSTKMAMQKRSNDASNPLKQNAVTVAVNNLCMSSIARCSTFVLCTLGCYSTAACDSIYIMDICVASIVVTITVIVCQLDVYFMHLYVYFVSKLPTLSVRLHSHHLSLLFVYVSLQSFLFTVLKLI